MKIRLLLMITLATLAGNGMAEPQAAAGMGLSKTSVFDTPTPEPFVYSAPMPPKGDPLPRAYGGFEGAPPQIPHAVGSFLPITAKSNSCLACHDRPAQIGEPVSKGTSPPMPRSHYGGFKGDGDKDQLSGARYNCTQCHVPQSGATPLVANTRE